MAQLKDQETIDELGMAKACINPTATKLGKVKYDIVMILKNAKLSIYEIKSILKDIKWDAEFNSKY